MMIEEPSEQEDPLDAMRSEFVEVFLGQLLPVSVPRAPSAIRFHDLRWILECRCVGPVDCQRAKSAPWTIRVE